MDEKIKNTLTEMLSPERLSRIDSVLDNRTSNLTILLDRIHHPHNIAAVIRSADAFGIKTVHLIESPSINDKPLSEAQKSPGISMGSEKWIEVIRHQSGEQAIRMLKSQGFSIVALAPPPTASTNENSQTESVCITSLPFEDRLCLLFGSELKGIDPGLESEADINAYIPMFGFVESFNISVACAITLFCSIIGKTSPERRTSPLSPDERETLRNDWIVKSVPRSEEIIMSLEKRNRNQAHQ